MYFYTNIHRRGNKLLVRGYENGKRFSRKVHYEPHLFVNARNSKDAEWHTFDGKPLARMDFESMKEARSYQDQFKEVENAKIYGFNQFEYCYLNERYPGQVQYDPDLIETVNIDIEIDNKQDRREGKAMPETIQLARAVVTAITMRHRGVAYQFGCGEYTPKASHINYYRAVDEADLLKAFLKRYEKIAPDVITGWNIEEFDMIYLLRRINNLLGTDFGKKLSPWGLVSEREVELKRFNKTVLIADLVGVTQLDYLQLYQKFTYTQQETYKLDWIAHVELGKKKLDYSAYEDLYDLCNKNFPLFMEYNDIDTALVEELDKKMGFLNQVFAIAYDAHVNFADALTSVRLWDVIIYRKLYGKNIAVNPKKNTEKTEKIQGAYVKEPVPGRYRWVMSFDLDSLYPHLIMGTNISPETLIQTGKLPITVDDILNGDLLKYHDKILNENVAVAGTGYMFTREFKGFLAELMFDYYNDRKVFKRKMLDAESEYEKSKEEHLKFVISLNNNMQMAKKIQLNSAYGALSNQFFRWYDDRLAESVTLTGQVAIQYLQKHLNIFLNNKAGTDGVDFVVASDTDSIYLVLDRFVDKHFEDQSDTGKINAYLTKVAEKVIQPEIDRIFDELSEYMNSFEQKMSMKLETIADVGIWTGKKRYILNALSSEGVVYEKPKVKYKGIEIVKSSTPILIRNKLKEAVAFILTGTEDSVIKFISDFRIEHRKMPFEDIAFPRGVNGLSKYRLGDKRIPIHVRASHVYNNAVKAAKIEDRFSTIQDGDKIKFCYLKTPNPVFEDVISSPGVLPRELGLEQYLDYYTMFEKTFVGPLKSILDVMGWRTEKRANFKSKIVKKE